MGSRHSRRRISAITALAHIPGTHTVLAAGALSDPSTEDKLTIARLDP
ncbi:hypothetical protein SAMN05444920_109110 [Nonomuraea solani]|uniref:Uncharacterized protein n=1 Tax=Nonomuraea solani TaxID=1144553 RepID=A0A1H6ECP3_9ACTN|nr:hypothetical protein SAMN05444920_109110 [Nonomuraea solani]